MDLNDGQTNGGYGNSYAHGKYNRFKKRKRKPFRRNNSTGVSVSRLLYSNLNEFS